MTVLQNSIKFANVIISRDSNLVGLKLIHRVQTYSIRQMSSILFCGRQYNKFNAIGNELAPNYDRTDPKPYGRIISNVRFNSNSTNTTGSVTTTSTPTTTSKKTRIKAPTDSVNVTFRNPDGSKSKVKCSENKTLYDAVIDNNVDIDGFGACFGTLSCSTCHLIFKKADYEKIGEPSSEEMDMLDLAYGLTDTSRLGCQVKLTKELDPLEVIVPESILDAREG